MDHKNILKKGHKSSDNASKDFDGNDSGHGDSEGTSAVSFTPVEAMTSRDFHIDCNAHVEMINQYLKDTVRIGTFKAAILHNKHLFKGKCVLNVGCGTGIYALFAAKAGASKVFAVDSSNVVHYTREIVKANGYSGIIEVIKGDIEQIELPVEHVDIIVSDWMGYALLFQSICDSVIYARDKWLKKPGGLIFPDQGKLYMVALEDAKHKNGCIDWWSDVYGFNMHCLRNVALGEPRYLSVKPEQVISKQFPIKSLNLNTATLDDLKFRSKFMLPIQKTGAMNGVALYFHAYFTKSHTPLGFSTDPWSPRTNWLQTVLFFDETLSVNAGSLYYGGIEFISTEKNLNLNDIIINLELLKGDPTDANVEVEMSWHFKPIPAAAEAKQKKTTETNTSCKVEANTNIALKSAENTEPKICHEKKKKGKNEVAKKNTLSCSGLVVTMDNLNSTITISKQNKPLRSNRKVKCKNPKKG